MHQRGVSLIEALVALAIMAFGMLGIVGMQSSLRTNADISKQRSEAVRIAQGVIEKRRGFWVLATAVGKTAYADIAVGRPPDTVPSANTTFTVTESVAAPPGGGQTKALFVDVTWVDRAGQGQAVQLSTTITWAPPELSGSLGVPALGAPTRLPRGRHAGIPPGADDQPDGTTSRFSPPGGGGVQWVFNNVTGYITQICVADVCSTFTARVLSGFVRFATDATQPTGELAEAPSSTAFALGVNVLQTFPTSGTVACYTGVPLLDVAYFCAVPIDSSSGSKWSGRSELAALPLSLSMSDATVANFKVCRYTTVSGTPPVPASNNENHPLDYLNVLTSLINQNFLVIRAGDGTTAFTCPGDGPSPLINGNTWRHQPST